MAAASAAGRLSGMDQIRRRRPSSLPALLLPQLLQGPGTLHLHLDFDGTLVPLQADPGRCQLDPALRRCLAHLAEQPRLRLAIVSGRSLADLMPRVGLAGIAYAGSHGLELACGTWRWVHPAALALQPLLEPLAQRLEPQLATIPGAWLERKPLGLSLHTRRVPAAWRGPLRRRLAALRRDLNSCSAVRLVGGHEVWEIRPALAWSKAEAVGWLLQRPQSPAAPLRLVYAGDDRSDEDVFRAWPRACTLLIGPGGDPAGSAARWCLTDPGALRQQLEQLARLSAAGIPAAAAPAAVAAARLSRRRSGVLPAAVEA
ncbi:MAG: trehalose-phosphatase [Synechococcus sp.]|nr:trehalose-phosphatase [Synechococcus sp.]